MKAAKDNPQLDVCSAHFNPAVALHDSAALKYLPLKVKPLDSIQQCRFLLPPSDPNYKALKKRRVNVDSRPAPAEEKGGSEVKQSCKVKRVSLFSEIADKYKEGPLSLLWLCYKNHWKIEVVIRSARSIRGSCTGFIMGFDKHFNMLLLDVEEKFTPISARSTDSKESGVRVRYYRQLLLKGDNVVLVRQLLTGNLPSLT